MNQKVVIYTLITTIALLLLIGSGLFLKKLSFSPPTTLENCNTLSFTNENSINLLFFSTKEQAQNYANELFSLLPYKENENNFNIYYIDSYSPNCEIYNNIALLCYSKTLVKKASSCPSDFIITLKDENQSIRSSSYMNSLSINTNLPKTVLIHELSHALVSLAEEYTPAAIPKNSQNCQQSCTNFKDSCFKGCSDSSYFRSTQNGIMRSLYSSELGSFDENLTQQAIDTLVQKKEDKQKEKQTITGSAISPSNNNAACAQQSYYLIEGQYKDNTLLIFNKTVEPGCLGTNGNGNLNYKIILNDDSELESDSFNPEFIFTDYQNKNEEQLSGDTFTSDKEFILRIPVIDNAKTLEIYFNDSKLTELNLGEENAIPCTI